MKLLIAVFAVGLMASLLVCQSHGESLKKAKERRSKVLQGREQAWHQYSNQKFKTEYLHHLPKPSLKATNPNDLEALKALYSATNGDSWVNSTGWLKGDPCQDLWHGLYCIDGRVIQINLVYNKMTGSLPAELAKADALQVLRLYDNQIGGSIPVDLFKMKSVQQLLLEGNQFTGELPDTISMPNLTQISLYQNALKGSVPSVWDTPQLEVIELSSNIFTGYLPDSIGKLSKLTNLVLSRNNLTGTFPSSWGSLSSLQQLWLFLNQFSKPTLPSSWSGMKSLQDVEIDGLTGELPAWIGSGWSQLQHLVLTTGSLHGAFPSSLCSLSELQDLRLFQNSLSGELPECLCSLTALQYLELSDNQFTGSIPDCIGSLTVLIDLYLSRNNLTGTLPSSVGQLHSMEVFDVSSNGLYGNVPSTINNLASVTVGFSICYNKFSAIDDGLEDFFKHIQGYSCNMYDNPWSCPLPSVVPKACGAVCSQCNSGNQHTSCTDCVASSNCGWCSEGPNCLEGSGVGPDTVYKCQSGDWTYGSASTCP